MADAPARNAWEKEAAAPKKKRRALRVQSLIFSKQVFSRKKAVEWAKTHDFKARDVDETETSYRLRQRPPNRFKPGSFRTVALTRGVKAVLGRLR